MLSALCASPSCEKRVGAPRHPGGNPEANLKSISHRCYLEEVAFAWELTKETIVLPLGCLHGGEMSERTASTATSVPTARPPHVEFRGVWSQSSLCWVVRPPHPHTFVLVDDAVHLGRICLPAFRALSGRLKCMVRSHKFNNDALSAGARLAGGGGTRAAPQGPSSLLLLYSRYRS